MAKTVVSVALDNPASDPNIDVGQSFSMDGTATLTGNHSANYDAHHQWDQGTGTWVDIDTTSTKGLYHAGTNPETGITGTAISTLTIYGGAGGSYNVRIRTVDHEDGDNEDLSGTQAVTVNAAAGRRGFYCD